MKIDQLPGDTVIFTLDIIEITQKMVPRSVPEFANMLGGTAERMVDLNNAHFENYKIVDHDLGAMTFINVSCPYKWGYYRFEFTLHNSRIDYQSVTDRYGKPDAENTGTNPPYYAYIEYEKDGMCLIFTFNTSTLQPQSKVIKLLVML